MGVPIPTPVRPGSGSKGFRAPKRRASDISAPSPGHPLDCRDYSQCVRPPSSAGRKQTAGWGWARPGRGGRIAVMASKRLDIRPVAGAIGAEIAGVDLARELDADTVAAIRQVWLDHLVIFFRDQELPPARLLALARRFGEPVEYPFVKGIDRFPEIPPAIKLEN